MFPMQNFTIAKDTTFEFHHKIQSKPSKSTGIFFAEEFKRKSISIGIAKPKRMYSNWLIGMFY